MYYRLSRAESQADDGAETKKAPDMIRGFMEFKMSAGSNQPGLRPVAAGL
jgi:hypothetical protein